MSLFVMGFVVTGIIWFILDRAIRPEDEGQSLFVCLLAVLISILVYTNFIYEALPQ